LIVPASKNVLQHWEVHVGKTAYTIFAKKGVQKVQYRPVKVSGRVFGNDIGEKRQMCFTQMSDDEILLFIKENWRGKYDRLDIDCHGFSRFLIRKLCNEANLKYPSIERATLSPARKFGKFLAKRQHEKSFWGYVARLIDKLFPKVINPINDKDEWEVEEHVKKEGRP
jgi:hypothetical protein